MKLTLPMTALAMLLALSTSAAPEMGVKITGTDANFLTRQLIKAGVTPDSLDEIVMTNIICQRGVVVYDIATRKMFNSMPLHILRLRMTNHDSDFACYLNGAKNPLEAYAKDSENPSFAFMRKSDPSLPSVIKNSLSDFNIRRIACDAQGIRCTLDIGTELY